MSDSRATLYAASFFAFLTGTAILTGSTLGGYIALALSSIGWFMRSAAYIVAEAIEKAGKK